METAQFNVQSRVLTLPSWDKASEGVFDMLVCHEVGHALYTPDRDWTEGRVLSQSFINIVEDARIEKLMKRRYEGVSKTFLNAYNELCDKNIGAEDYIELAKICKFIVIDNLPNFSDQNINQQQRFITLIDILYEHKIKLMISCNVHIDKLESSNNLANVFKRTLSRIYQLTSPGN